MFFRAEPVERRKELFDRVRESEELRRGIERVPITLVLGVRRVGKTSLVKAVTSGMRRIYIDLREFEWCRQMYLDDLLDKLRLALPRNKRLLDLLSTIEGVSLSDFEVKFRRGNERPRPNRLLEKLNEWGESEGEPVVIVLDEAQELAKLVDGDFIPLLAWAFDNLHFVKFVLTGSKAGLLYNFLRLDDAEAPLFGRFMWKVELSPLPRNLAEDFLRTGFAKEGLAVDNNVIKKAVDELDGIIGWLAYFGLRVVQGKDAENALDETVQEGMRLVWNEFCRFLQFQGINEKLALDILDLLTVRPSTEDDVAEAIGRLHGANLRARQVLKQLANWGYLREEGGNYLIADPLLAKAVKNYTGCLLDNDHPRC